MLIVGIISMTMSLVVTIAIFYSSCMSSRSNFFVPLISLTHVRQEEETKSTFQQGSDFCSKAGDCGCQSQAACHASNPQKQQKHVLSKCLGVQAGWKLLALPVAYVGDMAKKIIANTVPCL